MYHTLAALVYDWYRNDRVRIAMACLMNAMPPYKAQLRYEIGCHVWFFHLSFFFRITRTVDSRYIMSHCSVHNVVAASPEKCKILEQPEN